MAKIKFEPNEETGTPTATIRIAFNGPIKQVAPNMIEVSVRMTDVPIFSTQFIEDVAKQIGAGPCDAFLDEAANKIIRDLILKQTY